MTSPGPSAPRASIAVAGAPAPGMLRRRPAHDAAELFDNPRGACVPWVSMASPSGGAPSKTQATEVGAGRRRQRPSPRALDRGARGGGLPCHRVGGRPGRGRPHPRSLPGSDPARSPDAPRLGMGFPRERPRQPPVAHDSGGDRVRAPRGRAGSRRRLGAQHRGPARQARLRRRPAGQGRGRSSAPPRPSSDARELAEADRRAPAPGAASRRRLSASRPRAPPSPSSPRPRPSRSACPGSSS